jgi:RES domain
MFFGNTMTQRWDAPAGEYGVLYLGSDEFCAFMESIGRGVLRTRLVTRNQVEQKGFSKIRFTKSLRLIDLVSSGGLARIGAEGSLSSGSGYKNSQRWSKALRDHPEKPDGIYYYSRHDPTRTACALYDHCASAVQPIGAPQRWNADSVLLARILDHYGFGLG